MSEIAERVAAADLGFLDEGALGGWIVGRRWFGSKSREVAGVGILEAVPLRDAVPLAVLALAEGRFPGGTHEIYQLLLGFRPDDHGWDEHVIARADGWTAYDALFDPELAADVVQLMRRRATLEAGDALLEFCAPEGDTELDEP